MPNTFVLNCLSTASVWPPRPWSKASGSYSSLDRWVFHGDRLAPQVIHRPLTDEVSTLWYFTIDSLPVVWSWSSVSTAIGDGKVP